MTVNLTIATIKKMTVTKVRGVSLIITRGGY